MCCLSYSLVVSDLLLLLLLSFTRIVPEGVCSLPACGSKGIVFLVGPWLRRDCCPCWLVYFFSCYYNSLRLCAIPVETFFQLLNEYNGSID